MTYLSILNRLRMIKVDNISAIAGDALSEDRIAARAIHDMNISRLTPDDRILFGFLLRDVSAALDVGMRDKRGSGYRGQRSRLGKLWTGRSRLYPM